MEGAGLRGRWNRKAPVGTTVLLVCLFIPTVTLLEPSEEHTCPHWDYTTEEGVCCNRCSPGFKLVEKCNATGQRSKCEPCPTGQYMDNLNSYPNCFSCRRCKASKHEVEVSACESYRNAVCRCEAGYYKVKISTGTYDCRRCTRCGQEEKEKHTCTPEKNTVCGCTENYYRVRNKCQPCTNCSAECKHHCQSPDTMNTGAPETGSGYLVNVIAAVAVVAVALLVLVVVVTYVVTKRSTQKTLLKKSTQPLDSSPESCEQVLIHSEVSSDNMDVKAVPSPPVSEIELSNLPDCVPLEIKIPDLIYMVLELVPVLQVKQLVRSLGVKDTEIEQAELDYRSCHEAHYQMLRVWAERGSHAGGGGGGGGGGRMLHWHLLQELLDALRKMHLRRAAEELETKYNIQ